ncbi:MAG: ABC transporter ATP-binding protein [bacterium]|nr:ABC transporter ATP-binding protein [bacterium]
MNVTAVLHYSRFYRSHKGRLALGMTLSLLQSFLLLPVPILVGVAIDQSIPDGSTRSLVLLGTVIVLLTALSALVSVWASAVTSGVSTDAVAGLRSSSIERLMGMSRKAYSTSNPGSVHDQVVHESERVQDMASAVLDQFLPGTVLIIGLAAVLASLNLQIMFVTFAFAPVIYLASRLLGKWVMRRIDRYHGAFETFSRGVLGVLRSMDLIRIQGAEEIEVAEKQAIIEELSAASKSRDVSVTVYFVTQQALVAIVGSAVLIFGGVSVIRGNMTLGDLISFYAAFAMLRGPLSTLAQEAPTVIEGLQSLDRIYRLVETEERPYTGRRRIDLHGGVAMQNVSFGYADEYVVRDINLVLEPGTVVGIIGPNGAGKSTLVNLVLGFYRPDVGTVVADGEPYDNLDMSHLRHSMGVVPQQPLLRPGSVRSNIEYGGPPLQDEEINAALVVAGAQTFVADLADGIDTPVGEDGTFLSGGQRQRLAIARAIVHRPPLLVLDEPTNHLDRDSVGVVVKAIRNAVPEAAILLVSHRDEILRDVDMLLELKDGLIVSTTTADSAVPLER